MYVLWVLMGNTPSLEGKFENEKIAIAKGKEIMRQKRSSNGWITKEGECGQINLILNRKNGSISAKRWGFPSLS